MAKSAGQPEPPAAVNTEAGPDRLTLRLEGDLDLDSISAFRDQAFTAIGERPGVLLLDLSGVPFVDTAGLAALVTVARVARMVRVGVGVIPAPHLRRVLHLTGLIRVLPIVDAPVCECPDAEKKT
jgi:anti-anti-sigma factor